MLPEPETSSMLEDRTPYSSRRLLTIAATWLTCLLVIVVLLILVREIPLFRGVPSETPNSTQLVDTFGLDLTSFGIPAKVPKTFYLHLFHFLILLVLAGQLFLAWKQKAEDYLSWSFAATAILAVAYLVYASYDLRIHEEGSATVMRSEPLSFSSPPASLMWLLSLGSTLSLLFAGISARYTLRRLRTVQIAFAAIVLIGCSGWVLSVCCRDSEDLRSAPVAAASVTACFVCARFFFWRARSMGTLLAWTLLISFSIYGLVHFLEPLIYISWSRLKEAVFLLSFVTKAVAFLAIVGLALVDSHSSFKKAHDDLAQKHRELLQKSHEADYLLACTHSAFFQEVPGGPTISALGERAIHGRQIRSADDRRRMFADPSYYDSMLERLVGSGEVIHEVVELRHENGSSRFVSLRASIQRRDAGSVLQGFYHDITSAEVQRSARTLLDQLSAKVGSMADLVESLLLTKKTLADSLSGRVELYLASPDAGASPFPRFLPTSYLLGEVHVSWPRSIGDAAFNLLRNNQAILPANATDGQAIALRKAFSLNTDELLVLVGLTEHLHSNGTPTGRPRALGILACVLTAPPSEMQMALLEATSEVAEQLTLGLRLSLSHKLLSDFECLAAQYSGRAPLADRLEKTLASIADGRFFAGLSLLLVEKPAGEATSKLQRVIATPQAQKLNVAQELTEIFENRLSGLMPGGAQYVCEGHTWAWVLLPLQTEDSGPMGLLAAARPTTQDAPAPYSWLDEQYLSHLATQFAGLIARAHSDRSFRLVVGRISHDLQAPINAIRNKAHFLLKRWATLPQHGIAAKLRDIRNNAAELGVLAGRIDHFKEKSEPVRAIHIFRDVIQKTTKDLEHMFTERGATIPDTHRSYFAGFPIIYCRRTALDRIVQNIVVNFAKYGRDEEHGRAPKIEGEINRDGSMVVRFSNWGQSIEESEVEKIFEAGHRSQMFRSKEVAGEGMGLFIARDLAERELGGSLTLFRRAEPVEFHLYLPAELRHKRD